MNFITTNMHKIIFICALIFKVSGETCLDNDGKQGECIILGNCSNAIALIRDGKLPKLCRFEKNDILVCCTHDNSTKEEEFPPGCYNVWNKNKDIYSFGPTLGGGGVKSSPKEFSYMAALGYDGENNVTIWACGGTLISTQYVLTVAHCLHDKHLGKVKYVRLGDLNLRLDLENESPQQFRINETFRHPDYRPPAPYNDIGIIKLEKPCYITPYVIPACLNTKDKLPSGLYYATGWGQLGYGGKLADHLQKMLIRIFNHTECEDAYKNIRKRYLYKGIDEKTQVCAGAPNVDTCRGDSGGPLQHLRRDNTIYAVTSFGVACVISRIPGVYTKVSPFIPWIKSIISP